MTLLDDEVLSNLYDIMAIIISLADVTTDILITYEYYTLGYKAFFAISLAIICMAQLSYCIVFALKCMKGQEGLTGFCTCCCFPMLFAPFISLILYLFNDPQTCASKCCKRSTLSALFNIDDDTLKFGDKQQSDFNQFLMKKLSAHIGFILEAFVEAFPQSLLQMIAIVYYNNADALSVCSILLSMISVTSKSFVFSKGINLTQFFFTWLCVVTDFFGIFFAVSWAFYVPNSDVTIIGQIFFCKVIFGSLPIAIFSSIVTYFYATPKWIQRASVRECKPCSIGFAFVMSIFAFIVCGSVLCLFCEIFNFTLFALFIYYYATMRFKKYDQRIENEILNDLMQFITNGRSNHDKELRVYAVNDDYYRSFKTMDRKRKLERYRYCAWMDEIEQSQSLKGIKWKNMRLNAMDDSQEKYANFWNHIRLKTLFDSVSNELKEATNGMRSLFCQCLIIKCLGPMGMYMLFPLYLVSKIITFLYPFIIAIVLFVDDEIRWNEVPMFQITMLVIYVLMIFVLLMIGVPTLRLLYYLWHIAPGDDNIILVRTRMELVHECYDKMMLDLLIKKLLKKRFGDDIAAIVIMYYPFSDLLPE